MPRPLSRGVTVVLRAVAALVATTAAVLVVRSGSDRIGSHATEERLPRIRSPFIVQQIAAGGATYRVAVWRPPGSTTRRDGPGIVFLHGSGESGVDIESPTRIGLGPELVAHPERWPFVVVFPQKPSEQEEWEEREALVLAARQWIVDRFHVDPHRVALAGMSQGGHGAWMIGARHPERWSALVPICGYGRARTIAGRVARLPVWAFHGLRDDLVDPRDTRTILEAIAAERARLGLDSAGARLTLYPDANHNSWDAALAERDLPSWIASQRAAERGRSRTP